MQRSSENVCIDSTGRNAALVWIALGLLLVANLPLMLCTPLPADAVLYDLQARTALEGGVLYRDIVEPNLPGIVWCHMVIRSLFGWSDFALRTVDLIVVAAIIGLLIHFARNALGRASQPVWRDPVAAWAALVMAAFYLSTPEWVHCQRDIWLMLPALGALGLRCRQITRENASNGWRYRTAFVEGVLWAGAFWLKPHVAFPALAVIAASFLFQNRCETSRNWRWLIETSGILSGGLLVGAIGSAWLIGTGAWPHFWEMLLEWNPVYFASGRTRFTFSRYLSMAANLSPWCFVHLVAVPVAIGVLLRARRNAKASDVQRELDADSSARGLLAAFYLGSLAQAYLLQHAFHYAHVPGILLAMAVLASQWPTELRLRRRANWGFAAAMLLAATQARALDVQRIAWWKECLTHGSTPEVRCALHYRALPDWVELEPVVDYLREQHLHDGELTACNFFLVHLYPELGLKPSTRFVYLDVLTKVFHDRVDLVRAALNDSPQRFAVCYLPESDLSVDESEGRSEGPQAAFPRSFPMVFRSGPYAVFRVEGPVGPLNTAWVR